MKPLMTNERVFMWLSICPIDENTSERQKMLYVVYSVCSNASVIILGIASTLFVLENINTDLELAIFGVHPSVESMNLFYTYTVAFIFRRRIQFIFQSLSKICDLCKYSSKIFLPQSNEKSIFIINVIKL